MLRTLVYRFAHLLFVLMASTIAHGALANELQEAPFIMHSNQQPDSPTAIWLTNVYRELFKRINVPVQFVYYPLQRANIAAQNGDIDGQFTRIFEYQRLYKDQMRINVPIVRLSTIAYTRSTDSVYLTEGWSSLKDLELRVDYVRGIVLSQLNLQQQVKADYLTNSTDLREGLLKLKYNRTDIFVHGNIAVYPELQTADFKDDITPAGLLDVTPLYPYIHLKHFQLAPKMEAALSEMKKQGLILQYCIDAYGTEFEDFCRSIQPLN